jgi:hypothetical protein
MKSRTRKISADINDMADLKTQVMANAVATGNMFAFHDLFAKIREFAGDGAVTPALLDKIAYLLPTEETTGSAEYDAAKELVARHDGGGESVHAAVLEETARRAVLLKKFATRRTLTGCSASRKKLSHSMRRQGNTFCTRGSPNTRPWRSTWRQNSTDRRARTFTTWGRNCTRTACTSPRSA